MPPLASATRKCSHIGEPNADLSCLHASNNNPICAFSRLLRSQPGIDGFAFQGKHAKDAFMNSAQRLPLHKSLEAFNSESKLPQRQRALSRQPSRSQSLEVVRGGVFRPINDPQVL